MAESREISVIAGRARFTHDCTQCIDLGEFDGHDLYFCRQGGQIPTVLARFGNAGPEYFSGIPCAAHEPHLGEALVRAGERGLIQVQAVR